MNKRAFTLIELLVVIAIIAILAAILFPVFAQAKKAAKGAASLSNEKQITLASMMYAGDADDHAVVDIYWGDPNAWYWFGSAGTEFTPFSVLQLPYMKNGAIMQDPQTKSEATATGVPDDVQLAYFPQYGYNYATWSPVTDFSKQPWLRTTTSLTSVAQPAETVLFTTRYTMAEGPNIWWYGGPTLVTLYGAERPICNFGGSAPCFTSWGNGFFTGSNLLNNNREAGAYTGFNSLRKAGQIIVSWGDGHVSSAPPGRLAAGTNWSENISSGSMMINDLSKYVWDNQ